MKRGQPLRRTELKSRGLPLRAQSKKRQRENRLRVQAEVLLAEISVAQFGAVCCARCGLVKPVNGHEKLGRAQGGDPTRPDVLLCRECNTWCEDQPREAAATGWKVSRKYPSTVGALRSLYREAE